MSEIHIDKTGWKKYRFDEMVTSTNIDQYIYCISSSGKITSFKANQVKGLVFGFAIKGS